MSASNLRYLGGLAVRAAPYAPFAAAVHSQVMPMATGEVDKTLPGMVIDPIAKKWLGDFTFGPQY